MTSGRWEKVRVALGVLALAAAAVLLLVGPRCGACRGGIVATFGVDAPASGLCRVEYETDAAQACGRLELRIPAGRGEVTCFLPAQSALRRISVHAPDVRTGVIRLVGADRVVRADGFGHLPENIGLPPGRMPYWTLRRDAAPTGDL